MSEQWKLVPVEPWVGMGKAFDGLSNWWGMPTPEAAWAKLLAASPPAPQPAPDASLAERMCCAYHGYPEAWAQQLAVTRAQWEAAARVAQGTRESELEALRGIAYTLRCIDQESGAEHDEALLDDAIASAHALASAPTAPAREPSEAEVERISRAISDADDAFGYSMTLTRLVDDVSTYTLVIGDEVQTFPSADDCHNHIQKRRDEARARAILTGGRDDG